MAIRRRRKSRQVTTFKGKLYQYVLRDFANVPVTNALGQKKTDEEGQVKTQKRREISDIFTIYSQLAEYDQYGHDLYQMYREERLAGRSPMNKLIQINMAGKWGNAWKYVLKRFGRSAPKGLAQLLRLIEKDIGICDMQLSVLANKNTKVDTQGSYQEYFKGVSFVVRTLEFKRVIENYGTFLQHLFQMFGMTVEATPKTNPKMKLKYLQFELGDEVEKVIQESSEGQAEEIRQTQKLIELQKERLKVSLEKTGDLIETVPYYFEDGRPPVYLTVTYDPRVVRFPKPSNKPRKIKFTDAQKELILGLESLTKDVVYGDVDPSIFFTKPIDPVTASPEEVERHDFIVQKLEECDQIASRLAVPVIAEGYGDDADGNPLKVHPEGTLFAGQPIRRYTVPKKKRQAYKEASKLFDRLLEYHHAPRAQMRYKEDMREWAESIKPLVTGIYHEDFTLRGGASYKKFTDFGDLASKVAKSRKKKERALRDSAPQIRRVKVPMMNVEDWDSATQKMVRRDIEVEVTEFTYGNGNSQYQPPRYDTQLQSAINRMASGEKPIARVIKDGNGDEQFGITKSFKVMKVIIDGKEKDLIVKGLYAGYTVETVLNMEGRFLEGGYFQSGRHKTLYEDRILIKNGEVITSDEVDGKRKSRLIEPYITVDDAGTGFVLGLPSAKSSKNDRNLMTQLSKTNALITKEGQGIYPFYFFPPSEFNAVRDALGSVAMSRPAQDLLDAYQKKLIDIERSSGEENSERFQAQALGGFVEKVGARRFKLNNKQREACAWLDASGMSGVVALDTGVGKTLTTVASIKNAINQEMYEGAPKRRFLFVSPARLVGNLEKEISSFMDEGGKEITLEDGSVETTPNWKQIMLERVDEMSYEDYVSIFKDIDKKFTSDTQISALLAEKEELIRSRTHQGKTMTLTLDGDTIVSVQEGDQVRTASMKVAEEAEEVAYTQKVVTYPAISDAEKKEINKKLRKVRSEITKIEKEISAESYPKADKHFQKQYYCCFFDEVNEVLANRDKNRAMSALKHPRKVFLTASAIEKDPADLYKFVTLSKGGEVKTKDLNAFIARYGNVIGGKFVGLKSDPDIRREFMAWVKENTFFSIKTDRQYDRDMGVEYFKSGLPTLKKLQTTTYTVQMDRATQQKYKQKAQEVSRELTAMLKKYRDLRGAKDIYEGEGDKDFYELDSRGRVVMTHRGKRKKILRDFAQSGLTASIRSLIAFSNSGNAKSDQATSLFQSEPSARIIYFASDESLLKKVIEKNSMGAPLDKIHVLCTLDQMLFYRRGEVITAISANEGMSVDQFKQKLEDEGLNLKSAKLHKVAEDEDTEETEIEASWAIKISKEFIRDNPQIATIGCTDAYARGFNFQTFTKVIHLDRGEKFDSELIKQRTARAYRGGQAEQVEEIFIDATLTKASKTEGGVSTSAIFKDGPLENAVSLGRADIIPNCPYHEYVWIDNKWEKLEGEISLQEPEEGEIFDSGALFEMQDENQLFELRFDQLGAVKPVPNSTGEPSRRIIIPASKKPQDMARVPQGMEAISIDQLKSIVNEADQEFFSEIIREALSTDLIEEVGQVAVDTGRGVTMSKSLLRSIIDPTAENVATLVRDTQLIEDEPIRYVAQSATQWEDNPHLSELIAGENLPEGMIPTEIKKKLSYMGGAPVMNSIMGGNARVSLLSGGGVQIRGKFGDGRFTINRDNIYNDIVKLTPCAPKSYSARFVFSQVAQGIANGKGFISTLAAGSFRDSSYCGYAVWPKFGFNTDIMLNQIYAEGAQNNSWWEAITQILKPDRYIDLLDLYAITATIKVPDPEDSSRTITLPNQPVGEMWWARFGSGQNMMLDFTKGSKSMRVLNAYLKRKAQEANMSISEYLNSPLDPFNIDDPNCWYENIDNSYYNGKPIKWDGLAKLYPDAFKKAWYSHHGLRQKIQTEFFTTSEKHEAFLKKYGLVDPQNTDRPLPSEARVAQERERMATPPNLGYEAPMSRLGSSSEGLQDIGLFMDAEDPLLEAVWREIRSENRYNLNLVDFEENTEDPDLIAVERMRNNIEDED